MSLQHSLNYKDCKEANKHYRKMEFCLHCFRPNRPSPTSGHQSYATRLPVASSSVSYDVQRRNLVFHHLRNSIKVQRTNFGNNRFFVLCSKNRTGSAVISSNVYRVCGSPIVQEEEARADESSERLSPTKCVS